MKKSIFSKITNVFLGPLKYKKNILIGTVLSNSHFKFGIQLFLNSMIISGCNHTNNQSMSPLEVNTSQTETSEIQLMQNNNNVDILFIMDNSESMRPHQERLAQNIHKLVQVFDDSLNINYHIGVTPIFDSVRYGKEIQTFNPNGYLLPLKGMQNSQQLPQNYYTREHNNLDILAQSIAIGVLPLKNSKGQFQGPEFEEILSPIVASFSEPAFSSKENTGFYRDDAHLAIIMMTDADDSSPNLSGASVNFFLKKLKKDSYGNKITTYGVFANRKDCNDNVDPDLKEKPDRLIEFLDASRGQLYSICKDDYGNMLDQIGKDIRNKISKQTLYLKSRPELGTLKVSLRGKSLPQQNQNGWTYDPVKNAVILQFTDQSFFTDKNQLNIELNYIPAKIQNFANGRTHY